MATRRLCDDVTPLAVTSQSDRPASSDAMMFSIYREYTGNANTARQPARNTRVTTITITIITPVLRYKDTEMVQVTPLRRTLASSP